MGYGERKIGGVRERKMGGVRERMMRRILGSDFGGWGGMLGWVGLHCITMVSNICGWCAGNDYRLKCGIFDPIFKH